MDKPDNVYFADLVSDAMRQWAVAVARHLVWQADATKSMQTVRECWVGTGFVLYVRYLNRSGRFGARFAGLHIDPTSGQPLDPALRVHSSGSAAQQASNLMDGRIGGGPPSAAVEWTDDLGFGWWGDSPRPLDWAGAVNSPRIDTVYPFINHPPRLP
ncbi:hypothetical protein [Actinokineospora iranica]|uniref:Uncharacterized protein n=1 Tax=Actinokineospora iranica TaxID=1271860 RepID=A0A1G6V9S6_9PSEU|nr:hypothetical protein [Actinokineospora iranica]SDD50153.1 hypothetical protein SAMN05216174_1124 [Actinokineospora iranica]